MRLLATVSTLALASLALAGCAATGEDRTRFPVQGQQSAVGKVPTQLPENVRPLRYSISIAPDAPNLRFSGGTRIEVQVLEPTDSITFNAADLEIASASIAVPGRPPVGSSRTSLDAKAQTATLHFPHRLSPGRYALSIDYRGKINTQASGLFALDYESAGAKKRALFTQLAPVDARRVFPSWDEPNFRTPYDLRVTVPAGQSAISNMPEAGREQRPDGSHVATFRTTPAMSSYLLFLGMGEFERIAKPAAGTEVGIVTKAGATDQARFALDESAKVMPWFTDYFGTPYPLPKLDNVAGPGSSQFFAAMENWGAIFTFDPYLLVDPAITTEAGRQNIFRILTHEISHQWFGNLVTMAWWDDIWLNESFASWITARATGALHPEWQPELALIGTRETAMNLDAFATTHPVIQEVKSVEEMNQIFDVITYQKGEAVLTMLEDYVGSDAWRAGVRDYISAYKYQNTVTEDLWQKLEGAAGKPVSAIANDFTRQSGIPLIRVESASCNGGRTAIGLRQAEFSRDNPNKQPLRWRVPVIASTVGGKEVRALVENGALTTNVPGCGPVVVNRGQTGYYRTLYAPDLRDQLERSYAKLDAIDQIGLLADSWGLGLAGYQSTAEALDLVDAIPANGNPQLWGRAATILVQIHDRFKGDTARQALVSRYASSRLLPVLNRLGWSGRRDEPAPNSVLRAGLINALGSMGDATVVAEVRRRYRASDPSVVAGPLRSTILSAVAVNPDAATWDRLHQQARAEKSPQVRLQLYNLLASTWDEGLARRALALALTEEPGATISAAMIGTVAVRHPDLAFGYAAENRAKVEALVDIASRSQFIPGLANGSSDRAMLARLEAYARDLPADARKPVEEARAAVEDRARVREERLPDISRWLEARRGS
jgi:aminopeptidase N